MKQKVIFSFLLCGLSSFLACGASTPTSNTTRILPHRALISNLTSSRIDIADTSRDLLATAISGDLPGRLLLSKDKKFTLALSPIDNSVAYINNALQGTAGSSSLAGPSQGLVMTVDNSLILGAVPTEAGPLGQAPGAVDVITVTTGSSNLSLARQPSIPLPGVSSLAATPDTNHILALSELAPNPANGGGPLGRVWVIKTSLVNSNTLPYDEVVSSLWDHPVSAVVSADNTAAYVLNCGKECGGTQPSIVKIDLNAIPPTVVGAQLPVPSGATVAYLNGTTLYVAGSDPSVVCPSDNSIPAPCGGLTAVDTNAFSTAAPVVIAGGYHDRVTLGSNNLLFVGSHGCTINRLTTGPLAGCLSLFDTAKGTATIAPPTPFTPPATDPGDDVTGMTPIANRNEVYVIQGAELLIYDTTTGKTKVFTNPPNIIGQGVDVVAIDF